MFSLCLYECMKIRRTAPIYRMKLLPGTVDRPAVVHIGDALGVAIECEIWTVPSQSIGSFLAEIAPPLGLGTVYLDDGRRTLGFICDSSVATDAKDISHFQSWRNYRKAMAEACKLASSGRP
jgi:allophanate hydrolase